MSPLDSKGSSTVTMDMDESNQIKGTVTEIGQLSETRANAAHVTVYVSVLWDDLLLGLARRCIFLNKMNPKRKGAVVVRPSHQKNRPAAHEAGHGRPVLLS